ncbi:MAG: PaaI family thioesterase [Methyloligellaceae bacterium]
MSNPAPPEGFAPHFRKSNVTEPWEPIFSKTAGGIIQIGLWLSEAHCNSRGFVHGGVIASLADNAMGLSCIFTSREQRKEAGDTTAEPHAVTLNLSIDYAASAQKDQWLQIEPRVIKVGRSVGFVDALITADGKVAAKASAVFKMLSAS